MQWKKWLEASVWGDRVFLKEEVATESSQAGLWL